LNVYVNAAIQEGADNGDCCGPVAKGCGFTKEQNDDCCVEPKRDNHSSKNDDKARTCDNGTLNSSIPLSKSSTNCCSSTCCRNQDGKSQDLSLSNIDVNEWAGMFSQPYMSPPTLIIHRVIQNIRCEDVKLRISALFHRATSYPQQRIVKGPKL
jgi:hypothetical protein